MNPVEIEEAVSELALEPFDRAEFPFRFLRAFDNPETTIKRLRSGTTNQSDLPGGVLQSRNIHIAACDPGQVDATLTALRESPRTVAAKAKFILATDGEAFQAEDLNGGGTVACTYAEFPDHFGFFLALAGITTVKEIRESSFDVKATGRLNKLYVQLLKENPDWQSAERQPDMNHFMARLIFCFFAEDTDILLTEGLFTKTVEQMSSGEGAADTHLVIGEIFRAMDTKVAEREAAGLPRYALKFPYVNGQLFSGTTEVPRFSKVARSYLMHIGSLNWRKINPDIFGSMIQAVTDEEERGSLGMHYTSVPNILKVLNPLFFDDLREQLDEAGDNGRKLLNLRNRIARIRVFDPACGSGNFLVIAYKALREVEAEINKRRSEPDRPSDIPLTNFRGIELRDFPAEIARLALIIAEYQADVTWRGQKEAIADFLPLGSENWITCGNALRLDWLSVCPPTGTGVKVASDDLFETPHDQAEIDFANEGGETYICGNPPYKGSQSQDAEQKNDLRLVCGSRNINWKGLDYVSGWFLKASDYAKATGAVFAFVSTNSICQGKSVSNLWPEVLGNKLEIEFAYTSFPWANLASQNAGVTVVIVGVSSFRTIEKRLYNVTSDIHTTVKTVNNINAYIVAGPQIYIEGRSQSLSGLGDMAFENMPIDGGYLSFTPNEIEEYQLPQEFRRKFVRRIYGAAEYVRGQVRYCIWARGPDLKELKSVSAVSDRLSKVAEFRTSSQRQATAGLSGSPHLFGWVAQDGDEIIAILPRILSERREYIPVGFEPEGTLTTDQAYILKRPEMWNVALISSRLHIVWISTVCGRLKTDLRYSNTLGWNTFPVPRLTEQNKADLVRCAENILLAREAHFPATIAELYNPEAMPDDLRRAHDANDEVLERIYIGRRFRNDTERLEKLFELYTKMTAANSKAA